MDDDDCSKPMGTTGGVFYKERATAAAQRRACTPGCGG